MHTRLLVRWSAFFSQMDQWNAKNLLLLLQYRVLRFIILKLKLDAFFEAFSLVDCSAMKFFNRPVVFRQVINTKRKYIFVHPCWNNKIYNVLMWKIVKIWWAFDKNCRNYLFAHHHPAKSKLCFENYLESLDDSAKKKKSLQRRFVACLKNEHKGIEVSNVKRPHADALLIVLLAMIRWILTPDLLKSFVSCSRFENETAAQCNRYDVAARGSKKKSILYYLSQTQLVREPNRLFHNVFICKPFSLTSACCRKGTFFLGAPK